MTDKKKTAKVIVKGTRLVPKPIGQGDSNLGTITIPDKKDAKSGNLTRAEFFSALEIAARPDNPDDKSKGDKLE
jgi:hypothetical protein